MFSPQAIKKHLLKNMLLEAANKQQTKDNFLIDFLVL